jgi:hypothetical protein
LWCGTVGERTKPRYWRVYDKGVESGTAPAGQKWRVELEAKYHLAPKAAEVVCECKGETHSLWKQLGSWWEREGFSWPSRICESAPLAARKPARESSPLLGKMMWIQNTVAPTIPSLLEALGTKGVLELLGMDGIAVPRAPNDA